MIRERGYWKSGLCCLVILAVMAAASLAADLTDQEIRDLCAKSRDYRVKFQIIKIMSYEENYRLTIKSYGMEKVFGLK